MKKINFIVVCTHCAEKSNVNVSIKPDEQELHFKCNTCGKKEVQRLLKIDAKAKIN